MPRTRVMIYKYIALFAASFALACPSHLLAQEDEIAGAKAVMPNLTEYPDAGQEFGMVWSSWGDTADPRLDFAAPETDNRLWLMTCKRQPNGKATIVHQLEASSKGAGAGDRFGFTIRVDQNPSLGLIARMELTDGEGGKYYVPRFYTSNRHSLFESLAKGSRAYVNMNGNKFSVHLTGSGDAIKNFLRACG